MAQRQKEPLRPLTTEGRAVLLQIARASSERADRVARAKALLTVADGISFTDAAHAAGRRSGDAVAQLVARFNREGLTALDPRHGGGPPVQYGPTERGIVPLVNAPRWLLAEPDRVGPTGPRVRRVLAGQHPQTAQEVMDWLAATVRGWNADPTPFVWGGKRGQRRQRARERRHALGSSGGYTRRPIARRYRSPLERYLDGDTHDN